MPFSLPNLPYGLDALEPHYSKSVLEIHHGKDHKAYTDKLNAAVEAAGLGDKSIEWLLENLTSIPDAHRTAITNHGGGYYNHTFFWESMAPASGQKPEGKLLEAINKDFGSFDAEADT